MPVFENFQLHIAERPWRAGLYAFMTLIITALGLIAADYIVRPDSFPVQSVTFEGEFRHVDQQQLAETVIDAVRGNFLLLDLNTVRAKAQSVAWVHTADVRRQWPNGVHVRFTEQQLVARWGSKAWLNTDGDTVDLHGRSGPEGLPVLSGPDGMQARVLEHYRKLNELLSFAGLQIARLTLSARHSWSITLENGLQLTLGREAPEENVARFARAYPQSLAHQVGRIRRVDLRYTNGFAVEWNGRAAPSRTSDVMATGLREG